MTHLTQQPWLTAASSRLVLGALANDGATPRFVGGCVRDGLLGRASTDLDIAIDQLPEDSMRLLEAAAIKVIPTGLKHGTITALAKGQHFEITTLRVDVETFGRHARVAFTDDWQLDAARRDFTINAIYTDRDGQLYDPVGGQADLAAGLVRFVGDAAQRITEDKLRILRFFRFFALYGRGGPDAAALAACAAAAPGIAGLSGERVSAEVFKLLAAANPLPSLQLMAEAGVLSQILPDGFDLDGLARSDNDPLRRLSAIASAGAAAIAKRLRLSKQQASRLNFLIDPPAKLSPEIARPALRQLLYDHGANQISDLALQQGVPELLPRIDEATPPPFPLKGSDALALGMHAGPEIGNILRSLEDEWRANDFAASRDELLAALTDLKMDKG
ncbi:MAG: CCA tRNA nucleotidyltransferase [Rhodospirillaceae bacterium]|jgi:poly(A) polymerase|nr:CCA tRNA nucleotidyltransferase [Rhodospirillaceae bacterium]MBT3781828.1 CCA tRNA nucleotidyltransferase [Rhodospirillaceae bacterium]MBT3975321.1 CCA tRNA nucleotidyltransferase [Rhodospirillaceae bacterium]MBT4562137.1 CCA tRNA nucleotidyltransferase [Rhodospirillaceae bacterium]MBT4741705.1 CCA tRNA nucleotidyltransferase [Rhodospirillaceae bacterium]